MTDEAINRKFEIVAEHMATFAVGLQSLQEEVRGLARVQRRAEQRWERTEVSVRALLAAAEIQAEEIKVQAQEVKELTESVKAVDGRQREADERLNVLIDTVERYISERRNGKE